MLAAYYITHVFKYDFNFFSGIDIITKFKILQNIIKYYKILYLAKYVELNKYAFHLISYDSAGTTSISTIGK